MGRGRQLLPLKLDDRASAMKDWEERSAISLSVFTGKMVRGVGFEPTKAFATGFLLCRILSQAPSEDRRSCPFDLSPALGAFVLGLGYPRQREYGGSALLKPL